MMSGHGDYQTGREHGGGSNPAPAVPLPVDIPSLDQVREFIRASKAENTLRGYQSDWRAFLWVV